ncbi:GLPGLI family protein [Seonamhaeicola marinus]|uniref:GLPGLI family protein n=1 Tax=Seonamhaeicola marinus TaxID=1912246 RepID=A0A5D0HSX6_9FLAO|nr:GLPGLI family protein [Seonamhaeicola marinus]TYA74416.1 GLPGLI family protein [Seonamhaeicola marinus]
MKYLFLLVVVILTSHPKQTLVCGRIRYGFIPNDVNIEEKQNKKELYMLIEKMNEMSSDLEFILDFNSNESLFYFDEQMNSDLNPMATSFVKNIVSKGRYYYNLGNNELLREASRYEKYTLVKSTSSNVDWTLTNESKKIGNYTCYKAITKKINVNDSGIYEFLIEAWYTPQIPVKFGPKEFNHLPGLILELKDTHYTLYAKNISLSTNNSCKIEPLISKNIITKIQHQEDLKNSYKNLKQ